MNPSLRRMCGLTRFRKAVILGLVICLVFYLANYILPPDSFYTQLDTPVNSLDFGFPITPAAVCKSEGPRLLVLVLSAPENVQKRHVIRETWGNATFNSRWPSRDVDIDVKLIFLVGVSSSTSAPNIEFEAAVHGDVLQVDIQEIYGLNVIKKLLMGFKWIVASCHGTKHVLKVDDDVFVDIPGVVKKLKSPQYSSSICGHMLRNVFTKRFGKYKMTFEEYPYTLISEYHLGYFYVMPVEAAQKLVIASLYVPYLRMEDVYITGVLPRAAGVELTAFRRFSFDRDTDFDKCDFVTGKKDAMAEVTPSQMRSIWQTFTNPNICQENR